MKPSYLYYVNRKLFRSVYVDIIYAWNLSRTMSLISEKESSGDIMLNFKYWLYLVEAIDDKIKSLFESLEPINKARQEAAQQAPEAKPADETVVDAEVKESK